MIRIADASEVAAHFDQWLKEVTEGNDVVVTLNDKPVAKFIATTNTSIPEPLAVRVDQFPTLPGKWIGNDKVRHGDIADERQDGS